MSIRRAVVWVTEGTWESCVDAARDVLPADCEVVLVHVLATDVVEAATGARAGLLGRGRRSSPGTELTALSKQAAGQLLASAAQRLGREARVDARSGRAEREVLSVAARADLLVLGRDGDTSRPGPHSLGHATRFVVDHAPCQVLLVWTAGAPHSKELPPEPGREHPRGLRHHP